MVLRKGYTSSASRLGCGRGQWLSPGFRRKGGHFEQTRPGASWCCSLPGPESPLNPVEQDLGPPWLWPLEETSLHLLGSGLLVHLPLWWHRSWTKGGLLDFKAVSPPCSFPVEPGSRPPFLVEQTGVAGRPGDPRRDSHICWQEGRSQTVTVGGPGHA